MIYCRILKVNFVLLWLLYIKIQDHQHRLYPCIFQTLEEIRFELVLMCGHCSSLTRCMCAQKKGQGILKYKKNLPIDTCYRITMLCQAKSRNLFVKQVMGRKRRWMRGQLYIRHSPTFGWSFFLKAAPSRMDITWKGQHVGCDVEKEIGNGISRICQGIKCHFALIVWTFHFITWAPQ